MPPPPPSPWLTLSSGICGRGSESRRSAAIFFMTAVGVKASGAAADDAEESPLASELDLSLERSRRPDAFLSNQYRPFSRQISTVFRLILLLKIQTCCST